MSTPAYLRTCGPECHLALHLPHPTLHQILNSEVSNPGHYWEAGFLVLNPSPCCHQDCGVSVPSISCSLRFSFPVYKMAVCGQCGSGRSTRTLISSNILPSKALLAFVPNLWPQVLEWFTTSSPLTCHPHKGQFPRIHLSKSSSSNRTNRNRIK